MPMTGDKALQIVELAILRVRDRSHHQEVVKAFTEVAAEIAELQREYRASADQ